MNITSAESAVMEILWRFGPRDAEEITAALAESHAWSGTTVRTLLDRLIRKGAVDKTKESGRRIVFHALVQRADYVHAESRGLVDRLFDGKLGPLVAHFSEREDLSPEDIAELRALLARIDDGR